MFALKDPRLKRQSEAPFGESASRKRHLGRIRRKNDERSVPGPSHTAGRGTGQTLMPNA